MTSFVYLQPIYIAWEMIGRMWIYKIRDFGEKEDTFWMLFFKLIFLEIFGPVSDSESIHMPKE